MLPETHDQESVSERILKRWDYCWQSLYFRR